MSSEFQSRIKIYYHDLSRKEKSLADYLLNESDIASRQSIHELSDKIGISVATTSRFAKKIGYKNFQEMRLAFSNNTSARHSFFTSINEDDTLLNIASKTFNTNISSLQATGSMLSENILEKAYKLLQNANTLAFFGLGGSSVITFEAYHKFLRTPLKCFFNQDYHIQLMTAATLNENDVALVVSHTGRNKEVLEIVSILQGNHVPIIAITSSPSSPLAQNSNVTLLSIAEETSYRPESISSTVAQLTIVDALFLIYANHQKADAVKTIEKIREVIKTTRV
ncbi:transcriptional regulator [Bacilli bacterium]|nr:transcriptional regulator [Bacilli bacterium]